MKIALLSSLTPATGNAAQTIRLQKHLEAAKHEVILIDSNLQRLPAIFHNELRRLSIEFIFGVHLYRAGSLLIDCKIPYILIIGGTDINEHTKQPDILEIMGMAVSQAQYVVGFHNGLLSAFSKIWPDQKHKLQCIPPAAEILVPREFQFPQRPTFLLTDRFGYKPTDKIFLLPCNLRPVKDPLFLVDEFERWHTEDSNVHLLLIGPTLDAKYTQEVLLKLHGLKGVKYHPAVSAVQLQEAIIQSTVIVNSSHSEGLATVLIEAMYLGKPIIARNNVGNGVLVTHGVTGLLYSTASEFLQNAKELLGNSDLSRSMVKNAREFVTNRFSVENEKQMFLSLLAQYRSQHPTAPSTSTSNVQHSPKSSAM